MSIPNDIKTPDFYAKNHGVEVEKELRYPESGQVNISVNHNTYQSTRIQIGLAQAKELHSKLGELIAFIDKED